MAKKGAIEQKFTLEGPQEIEEETVDPDELFDDGLTAVSDND